MAIFSMMVNFSNGNIAVVNYEQVLLGTNKIYLQIIQQQSVMVKYPLLILKMNILKN